MSTAVNVSPASGAEPDPSAPAKSDVRGAWELFTVVAVLVVVLVPFANRALHLDDPFYVWVAQHIQKDPLDFYGFTVNWNGMDESVNDINKNPPGISYYLALVGSLFGWKESNYHAAFMLLAIAAAIGAYQLSDLLTRQALLATLIVIFSPVFLLSATNTMAEMGMLVLYVWALYLWIRGMREDRFSFLLISGFLAALSALTKYYGLSAIPLFLAYGLVERRRFGRWTLTLAVPLAIIAFYELYTARLYGRGHILEVILYADEPGLTRLPGPLRLLIGLAFVGGCTFPVILYSPFVWPRRVLAGLAGLVGVLVIVLYAGFLESFFTIVPELEGAELLYATQFALFIVAGVNLFLLAACDLYVKRDSISVLLLLWFVGTFLFAVRFNWAVNGRSLLAAAIPAGIYMARAWEIRGLSPGRLRWRILLPIAPAACLAVVVVYADYTQANVFRTGARSLVQNFGGPDRTLWYQGHWGFQHYMDEAGATHTRTTGMQVSKGDVLVTPYFSTAAHDLNAEIVDSQWELEIQPFRWLTTWNPKVGAGYYAESWGPMPFVIGRVPPEKFRIVRINFTGSLEIGAYYRLPDE